MAFANLQNDLSYWHRQDQPLFPDLLWNIPEQKTGRLGLIGGSSQGISTIVRTAEFLAHTYPLRSIPLLLPEHLRTQLPPLPDLNFAPATNTGSFAKSPVLTDFIRANHYTIILGDLSRNAITTVALTDAIAPDTPLLITRDAIDLLAPSSEQLLTNPHLTLLATMSGLQKIFRAVYYPKMLMLSSPLLPVLETLHKFTLTYPVTIITFHTDQIITAHAGNIITTALGRTPYTPLTLWSGELAAKIAALTLYNPTHPLEAATSAILS